MKGWKILLELWWIIMIEKRGWWVREISYILSQFIKTLQANIDNDIKLKRKKWAGELLNERERWSFLIIYQDNSINCNYRQQAK